jgi:hypothetical protein
MQPTGRSGKATAGFVLGLASILLFITIVVPILAIVFGLLGAKEVKQSAGRRTGLAFARIGWVLGLLGLLGGAATWVAVGNELATTSDVHSLEVGDCVDLPDDETDEISRLDDKSCDEPHDAEVFSVGDLGDGDDPYPGSDEVDQMIADICIPDFEDYVGTPYGDGELEVYRLFPQEKNWNVDQGYVCMAYLVSEEQLTETVEDSGR